MPENNYTLKICTNCNIEKNLSCYSKNKTHKDGLSLWCKSCERDRQAAYRKTKEGVATAIYGGQRASSKRRNHTMPDYTKADFVEWLFRHHEFHRLYDLWVISGYHKMQKPSCDRFDDYKPYTLDNIKIMTWQENYDKSTSDVKNGINNKKSTAINQYSMDGLLVANYHSMRAAARETGCKRSGIGLCCKNIHNHHHGYRWSYA